jgi:hypothetical protein
MKNEIGKLVALELCSLLWQNQTKRRKTACLEANGKGEKLEEH